MLATPETARQVAPLAADAARTKHRSAAEAMLETKHADLRDSQKAQLAQEAWWARRWRDPGSPYAVAALRIEEQRLASRLLREIDPRCFPAAGPGEIDAYHAAVIVCEVIALGAQMLTTASLRSIDRVEVNRWATANADRLGFTKQGAVFSTDTAMSEWTTAPADLERWIQAGLLACWPADDDASAKAVIHSTLAEMTAMITTKGCKLPTAGARLINGIEHHPDPIGLVEQTRKLLPSSTLSCERAHPAYSPADPRPGPPPAAAPNAPAAPEPHATRHSTTPGSAH